jgi:hypothetical protein
MKFQVKNGDKVLGEFSAETRKDVLDQFVQAHGIASWAKAVDLGIGWGRLSHRIGLAPGEIPELTLFQIKEGETSELRKEAEDQVRWVRQEASAQRKLAGTKKTKDKKIKEKRETLRTSAEAEVLASPAGSKEEDSLYSQLMHEAERLHNACPERSVQFFLFALQEVPA